MKKEKQDTFKRDLLRITGSQDQKIEKLTAMVDGSVKAITELIAMVKEGKQQAVVEQEPLKEATYVVFTTSTQPMNVIPREEFLRKTQEVLTLIKPILVKYGMSQLCAFLVEKK